MNILTLVVFLAANTQATAADNRTTYGGSPSSSANWATFRGDEQLRGVAPGELGDHFKLLWTFKTPQPIKSSAVISEGIVFIGSNNGYLYALSLAHGEEHWALKTDGPIEAPPLVVGGVVFAGSGDGYLYAVDALTGNIKWKHPTGDQIIGSANLVRSPDGRNDSVIVGSYDNCLYCLDAETGKPRWTYETDNYVNGAAAISNGKVVFGGCDGNVYVLSVDEGRMLARIELGSPIAGSAAVAENFAFIGHYGNQFVRIDLKDAKVNWRFEDQDFPFFSSAAIGTDRVVFGSRARRIYCVKRDSGELLWSFRTRGKVDSSPVICGNKVVIGSDDGRLYVLELESGRKLWSYQIGAMITGSVAVADGMIVVGAEDGVVYGFVSVDAPVHAEAANDEK